MAADCGSDLPQSPWISNGAPSSVIVQGSGRARHFVITSETAPALKSKTARRLIGAVLVMDSAIRSAAIRRRRAAGQRPIGRKQSAYAESASIEKALLPLCNSWRELSDGQVRDLIWGVSRVASK